MNFHEQIRNLFKRIITNYLQLGSRSSLIAIWLVLSGLSYKPVIAQNPEIDKRYEKKISDIYIQEMSAYNRHHYGMDTVELKDPKIIIVHATYTRTFEEILYYFQNDYLNQKRPDLNRGGKINTATHYIVDRNGKIYSFIPENYISRHAVGLNYTSLGIENVAASNKYLTKAQLKSNVILIRYLLKKYPSVKFVIGHHEYRDPKMPHFPLIITKDPTYKPWHKTDPGPIFMKNLRKELGLLK